MVTLSLLRHAKSAWDNPELGDFERPLAPRGRKAAPLVARYIAANALEPDLIWCSPARRARQTLALVLEEFCTRPKVTIREDLYHASSTEMTSLVHALPGDSVHAMFIGHNPGLQALVLELVGRVAEPNVAAIARKFPTAALAIIAFSDGWGEVRPGGGKLVHYVTPAMLT